MKSFESLKLFPKSRIDLYIAKDGQIQAFYDGNSYEIKPQDALSEGKIKAKSPTAQNERSGLSTFGDVP